MSIPTASDNDDALKYGSAPERRARILQIVREQGFSSTAELVAALGVSDGTIRRDTQKLAEEGLIRLVHGGASVLDPADLRGSGPYADRSSRDAVAKRLIGQRAAGSVRDGEIVALDAGTTVLEVARALPSAIQASIVTHSAPVIAELLSHSNVSLTALGGALHRETLSFASPGTLAAIQDVQVSTLFLAASGVRNQGVYCANDFDAVVKRALIAAADRVVLLVDASKFQTAAMVRICGFDAVDCIITDWRVSDDQISTFRSAGLETVVVHNPTPAT